MVIGNEKKCSFANINVLNKSISMLFLLARITYFLYYYRIVSL